MASANFVSLEELLLGFEERYPTAPSSLSLDLNLEPQSLASMARFARVTPTVISRLFPSKQVPSTSFRVALTGFGRTSESRLPRRRLGYAFCSSCLARQSAVHVRWPWFLAFPRHCLIHGERLHSICLFCGVDDPLPFGAVPERGQVPCCECGANLLVGQVASDKPSSVVLALESAYRGAVLDSSLRLFSKSRLEKDQLRRFIDDVLRLLPCASLHRGGRRTRARVSSTSPLITSWLRPSLFSPSTRYIAESPTNTAAASAEASISGRAYYFTCRLLHARN